MKSLFSIFILFIALVTLTACANNAQTSIITIDDSDSITTIMVSGELIEDEVHFNNDKYDISIQALGDNLFHLDAKITFKRIDKETGDELVSSNQIVTRVRAEPEEKVTIGALDSWSESVQKDGCVIETRVEKRYVLKILKSS